MALSVARLQRGKSQLQWESLRDTERRQDPSSVLKVVLKGVNSQRTCIERRQDVGLTARCWVGEITSGEGEHPQWEHED